MSDHLHDSENPRPVSLPMVLRLARYLKLQKRSYFYVCLSGLIIAFLEMVPPKLVGNTVNGLLAHTSTYKSILLVAGIWCLIVVAVQFLYNRQILLANRAGETVLGRIREDLFNHLQRLSMSYFDRTRPGKIVACASNDVDSIRNILIWGTNTLVANSALMILAALMIFLTDRRLFFATFWLAPAMTLVNYFYGKYVSRAWQSVRRHSTLVGANQEENIAGQKVVVAFNRQEQNLEYYNELQRINTHNNVQAAKKSGLFQPLLQMVRFAGQILIFLLGGYRVAKGDLKAGDLVAVALYWDWFMQPAINFGIFFNDVLVGMAGAERLFTILDEIPEVSDVPGARDLPKLKGRVEFQGVTFSYNPGRPVLKDVGFYIPPGTNVALVGATGSGKSTIISLLARFYQPQQGRILIDGHDIRRATSTSLHRQMAMVLQNNYLFSGTVMENIRYARPDATKLEVYSAAAALGCHERFSSLKDGYDTMTGEKGGALSLGERQLICFTRALLADPSLLLLDEATSALDPLTSYQVQRAMKKLIQGRTTFMVTHRMSTAASADLVMVLENGHIVESGSPQNLLSSREKFFTLYSDAMVAHV